MRWSTLAAFASTAMSRPSTAMKATMRPPVTRIDRYGVANFGWISLSQFVTIPSRPIAKLIRADARIDAFVEEAVASSAPTVITAAAAATPPIGPIDDGNDTAAACATGASALSSVHGTTPSIAVTRIA
jgi:hypothetical protein